MENKDNFKILVPPIKSQGKKTKLVHWINDVYEDIIKEKEDLLFIEPFVGTGVVGFNIAGKNAIFSDSNIHLINFYKAIQNNELNSKNVREFLEQEGEKLKLTGTDKSSYYYELRNRFNEEHSPFDFLFLTRSCFNGMMRFSRKGKFNVPFCKKPERFSASYITKICNQIYWLENKIKNNNWKFISEDFSELLLKYKDNENVVFYLDPPYIGRHTDYYNGWGDVQETQLADILENGNFPFILSTWFGNQHRSNSYIESHWNKYNILTKEHYYHVGAEVKNRNAMTEALIVRR